MSERGANRAVGPVRRGATRSHTLRRRVLGGQHAAPHVPGGGKPPSGGESRLRWQRGRPAYYGIEWPFWLLMLAPWLAWGLMLLLTHLGVCLICLPH